MPASFYSFFSLKILREKLPPDVTTRWGIFMLSHDNNDLCVCVFFLCKVMFKSEDLSWFIGGDVNNL